MPHLARPTSQHHFAPLGADPFGRPIPPPLDLAYDPLPPWIWLLRSSPLSLCRIDLSCSPPLVGCGASSFGSPLYIYSSTQKGLSPSSGTCLELKSPLYQAKKEVFDNATTDHHFIERGKGREKSDNRMLGLRESQRQKKVLDLLANGNVFLGYIQKISVFSC